MRKRILLICLGLLVVVIGVLVAWWMWSTSVSACIRKIARIADSSAEKRSQYAFEKVVKTKASVERAIYANVMDKSNPLYGRVCLVMVLAKRKTPDAKRVLQDISRQYSGSMDVGGVLDEDLVLEATVVSLYRSWGQQTVLEVLRPLSRGGPAERRRALAFLSYPIGPLDHYYDVFEQYAQSETERQNLDYLHFILPRMGAKGLPLLKLLERRFQDDPSMRLRAQMGRLKVGDRSALVPCVGTIRFLESRDANKVNTARSWFDLWVKVRDDTGPFEAMKDSNVVVNWVREHVERLKYDAEDRQWSLPRGRAETGPATRSR